MIGTGDWEQTARKKLSEAGPSVPGSGESPIPTCMDLVSFKDNKGRSEKVDVVFPVLHGPNGEDRKSVV